MADITLVLEVANSTAIGAADQVYLIPQNARYVLINNTDAANPVRWAYGTATGAAYQTLLATKTICIPVPGAGAHSRNMRADTRKLTLYSAAGATCAVTALFAPVVVVT